MIALGALVVLVLAVLVLVLVLVRAHRLGDEVTALLAREARRRASTEAHQTAQDRP